jgi:lipopolysaccharide export system protein LptC
MSESRTALATRVRFDPTRPRDKDIYVKAFRHSRRVGVLRITLPVIAVVAVGGFFVTMRFADLSGAAAIAVGGININTKSLVMDAPHMSGFDSNRRPYQVKATKAVQDLVNPKIVNLETIDAHFATDDTNTAVLKARAGILDNLRNRLGLRNGITIVTSDGYHVTMVDADIDISKGTMVSHKPVEIHSDDGSWLKANGASISDKGAKMSFVDGVTVHYIPADDDNNASAAASGQAASSAAAERIKSATE